MTSSIWLPMVITGFSEDIGSWKIKPMRLPRILHSSNSECLSKSSPCRLITSALSLALLGNSLSTDKAVIDLPEPDSPTKAKVSPAWISKLMSSTTFCRWLKVTLRCLTVSIGLFIAAPSRIERILHHVGKQIGRQYQREHKHKGGRQRPPHDRFARHFQPCAVNHITPAVAGRIDADIDVRQHRFCQHQGAKIQHHRDQH